MLCRSFTTAEASITEEGAGGEREREREMDNRVLKPMYSSSNEFKSSHDIVQVTLDASFFLQLLQVSKLVPSNPMPLDSLQAFFFPADAFAFAAFSLLLLIITTLRKLPTTAEPRSIRMTGMRMAQTRGGKRSCRGWPGSTNGCSRRGLVYGGV